MHVEPVLQAQRTQPTGEGGVLCMTLPCLLKTPRSCCMRPGGSPRADCIRIDTLYNMSNCPCARPPPHRSCSWRPGWPSVTAAGGAVRRPSRRRRRRRTPGPSPAPVARAAAAATAGAREQGKSEGLVIAVMLTQTVVGRECSERIASLATAGARGQGRSERGSKRRASGSRCSSRRVRSGGNALAVCMLLAPAVWNAGWSR